MWSGQPVKVIDIGGVSASCWKELCCSGTSIIGKAFAGATESNDKASIPMVAEEFRRCFKFMVVS
jgi:hypothetical protein